MRLIDAKQRRALERFFDRCIRPRAEPLESTTRDENVESYWIVRESQPLRREDLELALDGPEEVAATLDALWRGTRLEGLGTEIAALSREFPNVRERSDVSSFIYEMF